MYWKFEEMDAPDYIRITTSGPYSSDDFLQVYKDLVILPYWKLGAAVLMDNRNIDLSTATPNGLLRLARGFLSFNNELIFTRMSILYNSERALRMATAYGQITDSRTKACVKRFLDEKLALDWISPRAAAASNG